jgi:hypothetical protein
MPRRLIALAVAIGLASPAIAAADDENRVAPSADTATIPDATEKRVAPVATQEIGARLGLRMGGRTTPGGFSVGGVYLYQLTDVLWSDSTVSLSVGGGGADCFRDRGDDIVCDHGQLDGVAGGAHSGLRLVQREKQGFVPYARATVGIEVVNFADDDVRGFSIPLTLGAGVRARVADRVAVSGGADLLIGFARLNRDIGAEPQAALIIHFGVDFAL